MAGAFFMPERSFIMDNEHSKKAVEAIYKQIELLSEASEETGESPLTLAALSEAMASLIQKCNITVYYSNPNASDERKKSDDFNGMSFGLGIIVGLIMSIAMIPFIVMLR